MATTFSHDIIVAGAGLSGLTLAVELCRYPAFQDKRILLLDRDDKRRNDRTWCFWATPDEPLPPVLHKTWPVCDFYGDRGALSLDIAPFRYCMVRGVDFYAWAHAELARHPRVERVQASVLDIDAAAGMVRTDRGDFQAPWVFNSALLRAPVLPPVLPGMPSQPFTHANGAGAATSAHTFFLQHFKGWIIRAADPAFDPACATLMDFRVDQGGDTRFVYVLPFNEREALVEYTLFSPALLPSEAYDAALKDYLRDFLYLESYDILETEFGVIPMTDHPIHAGQDGRVIHIGTAGGFVKGSSGYAFKRTMRKTRRFAADWAANGQPDAALLRSPWRNRFYDSVLLRVLRRGRVGGKNVFSRLFGDLPAPLVFRFLDEDTTFVDDLRIMNTAPKGAFLYAVGQQIPHLLAI